MFSISDVPKPSTSAVDVEFEADMKILKEFDLNWEYGPSVGMLTLYLKLSNWLNLGVEK